jgi:hypothetical protein
VTFFSSQRYEMIVENSDGHEVWRWSNDLGFAQPIAQELLTSVTYSEEWDQRDNRGQPVPPGRYEVTAWLTGLPHEGVDVGPCRSEQSNCFPSAGQSIVISP